MKIFDRQKDFFNNGNTESICFRKQTLQKLLKVIQENEQEINNALKIDLNKPEFESYLCEVSGVYSELKLMIKKLKKWAKPIKARPNLLNQPAKGKIISEPYGNVLIYSAWNFPFYLTLNPLIGAIAAGNCCLIKPSEYSPATAKIIAKIVSETFDPAHAAVIQGDAKTAANLMDLDIDLVFFTGSAEIGKKVYQAAAEKMIPAVLELGGKSPAVICESCELKTSTKRLTWGKMMNAGQTCVAPDYALVEETVLEKFIAEMKKNIIAFYGENAEQSCDFPRIITEQEAKRLEKIISTSNGKVINFGTNNPKEKFIAPTIIINPDLNSALMQHEIFGPILPVISCKNITEAIKFIKSRPKPLAAYIFSGCKKEYQLFTKKISAGGIGINEPITHLSNATMPFGGVGESGIGSYHGKFSFDTFSHQKPVHHKPFLFDPFIRYAPYKNKIKIIKKIT